MAYTPVTSVPTLSQITFFQWETPTAPAPRLASPISATDTTITFTSPPLNHTGTVVSVAFLMGIENSDGYVETVKIPAGALSADGLTATGVVRGIRLEGLDWTTGDPALASDFNQDSPVFCNISGVLQAINTAGLTAQIGANIMFNGRPLWSGNAPSSVPVFATTVVRDATLTSPQNGDMCYVTSDGVFYDYQGGAWAQRANGAVSNATTLAAGKVRIEDQATFDAGLATVGGDPAVPQANIIQAGIQKGSAQYATTGGGPTAYTLTLTPVLAAYTTGQRFYVKWNTTNTGSATLSVDGLAALPIKKNVNQDIIAGDLPSGGVAELMYDGTNLQIGISSVLSSQGKWGGTGSDGAIDGNSNVTIAGSNNTYIVKNYTSWAAAQGGAKTLTITPTNCILHIKIQGNADFTNWILDFKGKGAPGGTGGAAPPADGGNHLGQAGTDGTQGKSQIVIPSGGGGAPNVAAFNAGGGPGVAGTVSNPIILAYTQSGRCMLLSPGAGGGGGASGNYRFPGPGGPFPSGVGGDGGFGGGCVIFEIGGNVTFSGTTATVAGNDGSNGGNATVGGDAGGGGAGSGGGAGIFLMLYGGSLSGSLTPTITGGAGGVAGVGSSGATPGGGGSGGSGSSAENDGTIGNTGGTLNGAAGSVGATGQYLIEKNTVFA